MNTTSVPRSTVRTILLIAAVLVFLLAAFGVSFGVGMVSLGSALFAAAFLF